MAVCETQKVSSFCFDYTIGVVEQAIETNVTWLDEDVSCEDISSG